MVAITGGDGWSKPLECSGKKGRLRKLFKESQTVDKMCEGIN
jgi:hypothetical protein